MVPDVTGKARIVALISISPSHPVAVDVAVDAPVLDTAPVRPINHHIVFNDNVAVDHIQVGPRITVAIPTGNAVRPECAIGPVPCSVCLV